MFTTIGFWNLVFTLYAISFMISPWCMRPWPTFSQSRVYAIDIYRLATECVYLPVMIYHVNRYVPVLQFLHAPRVHSDSHTRLNGRRRVRLHFVPALSIRTNIWNMDSGGQNWHNLFKSCSVSILLFKFCVSGLESFAGMCLLITNILCVVLRRTVSWCIILLDIHNYIHREYVAYDSPFISTM
jgi:hypothetical protein